MKNENEKSGREVFCEVENIVDQVCFLTNIIQLLIDSYDLDSTNKDVFEDVITRTVAKKHIHAVLIMTQWTIERLIDDIESLNLSKDD